MSFPLYCSNVVNRKSLHSTSQTRHKCLTSEWSYKYLSSSSLNRDNNQFTEFIPPNCTNKKHTCVRLLNSWYDSFINFQLLNAAWYFCGYEYVKNKILWLVDRSMKCWFKDNIGLCGIHFKCCGYTIIFFLSNLLQWKTANKL